MLQPQTISNAYITHPVSICRMHLNNYKLYDSGATFGIKIAKKAYIEDELALLLHNLIATYGLSTVILALRSVKMYKYCVKYLKVG